MLFLRRIRTVYEANVLGLLYIYTYTDEGYPPIYNGGSCTNGSLERKANRMRISPHKDHAKKEPVAFICVCLTVLYNRT